MIARIVDSVRYRWGFKMFIDFILIFGVFVENLGIIYVSFVFEYFYALSVLGFFCRRNYLVNCLVKLIIVL